MASSSKQRKIDESSTEGYIHSVTPVKLSRNGFKYFNAKLQEKQDVTDMVCFQGEDLQEKMARLAKVCYIVRSNFRMSTLFIRISSSRETEIHISPLLPCSWFVKLGSQYIKLCSPDPNATASQVAPRQLVPFFQDKRPLI